MNFISLEVFKRLEQKITITQDLASRLEGVLKRILSSHAPVFKSGGELCTIKGLGPLRLFSLRLSSKYEDRLGDLEYLKRYLPTGLSSTYHAQDYNRTLNLSTVKQTTDETIYDFLKQYITDSRDSYRNCRPLTSTELLKLAGQDSQKVSKTFRDNMHLLGYAKHTHEVVTPDKATLLRDDLVAYHNYSGVTVKNPDSYAGYVGYLA